MRIPRHVYDAIIGHALADHPVEACGVVAAPKDGATTRGWRWIPMDNVEQRPTEFFRFDPNQQLLVWQDMELRGERPAVIYHSHTSTTAYPSHTDVCYAVDPDVHYVIVSTQRLSYGEDLLNLRSFRIVGGRVTEEAVEIDPDG